jgi:hypothetical protein
VTFNIDATVVNADWLRIVARLRRLRQRHPDLPRAVNHFLVRPGQDSCPPAPCFETIEAAPPYKGLANGDGRIRWPPPALEASASRRGPVLTHVRSLSSQRLGRPT